MRSKLVFVLGVVMALLGAVVVLHLLWPPHRPITGYVWLDLAFALVFFVRGYMNIRSARRRPPLEPDVNR